VTDNSVAYCSYAGLYIHNSHNLKIERNTLFDNGHQVAFVHDHIAPQSPLRNINFSDNVLFSKKANQLVMKLRTIKDDIQQFGTFNNNFYSRPEENNFYIQTTVRRNDRDVYQSTDTEGWKASFNHDISSKKSPLLLLPVITSKILGGNKILNGNFAASIRDESCWSPIGDCSVGWAKDSKLDGGALQVSFSRPGAVNSIYLTIKLRDIVAQKKYAVKFSLAGTSNTNPFQVFLRKEGEPYNEISDRKKVKITENRGEHTVFLQTTQSQTEAVLVFEVTDPAGTFWIDNLEVNEAEVTEMMPNRDIRFEYNASKAPVSVVLNKAHIDGRGAYQTGAVTLQPFSSIVLMENDFGVLSEDYLKLNANWTGTNNIKLNWRSSNNSAVSGYEVQRSEDQKSFNTIGQVTTSNLRIDPNAKEVAADYNDKEPLKQHNYYRIKRNGADGKSAYSNVIHLASDPKIEWKLYPNPATKSIRIQLNDLKFRTGKLSIFNVSGVEVYSEMLSQKTSFQEIDISKLPEGTYVLRITYDQKVVNKEFVKIPG
jgi:parallel beta-helix repeat protein